MPYVFRAPLVLVLAMASADVSPSYGEETSAEIHVFKDIAYYTGKDADPERNRLDLYLPKDLKDFPVLFWVHGGGLQKGDRKNTQPLGETFARQGVGFVTTGYRLSPGVKHPAHIEDVARAFVWTVTNIGKHGGRADAVFVGGYSAGGTLVSLLTTDESYLQSHDLAAANIKGVISLSGPQRLEFDEQLNDTIGSTPEAFATISPLNYVGSRNPPFLLLFAEKDLDIVRKTSDEMRELLKKHKIDATVLEIKDRDHGSMMREVSKPGDPAARAMLEFIRNYSSR